MSDVLAASPLVRAIGVALIEFVWQGVLIGLVTAGALRALRGSEPTTRYAVTSLTLLAMACMPVATAALVYSSETARVVTVNGSAAMPSAAMTVMPASTLTTALGRELWLPVIVLAWGLGVTASGLHLAASWLLVGALRRNAARLSLQAQRQLARLAGSLGIRRHVEIAESGRVAVPTVMGWVRPLIVVPASTLAGLSPKQLEAILVHELAHVRRHDYAVNVLQTVIETVLFYHPAVWWMSRRVRVERELCCDDLVVGFCGDRRTYAHALAELEAHRLRTPSPAVAANGGDLMNRITRLLGTAPADRSATPIGGVLAVLVAVPLLLIGQTATSARTPAATVEMPIPPAVLTTAAQAAPPILVSGPMLAQVAEATTTRTRSRYGALLERYRAVVLAYSTQNAQPAAVPTPPGTYAETRQARDEQRTWVALQMINAIIKTTQELIAAGKLTEASANLARISELLASLPPSPPPPPPPPPPPTGTPTATEQAAASYAQALAASGGPGTGTPPPGVPVRVGGSVAAPVKIRDVAPIYPENAKAENAQGIVILECVIDPGGNVVDIRILRGHPLLNEAALQAVSQWKYTAPTLQGNPVSVIMTVTVNFTLNQ